MKKFISFVMLSSFFFTGISLQAQSSGEELYKTTCAACHTIGKGRLVGPDLIGINEKRDQDWLIHFIRSSQKMVSAGDSLAVALYEEYNNIPMPDNNLSDEKIVSILDYISETGASVPIQSITAEQVPDTSAQAQATPVSYPPDLLKRGKALFYGYEKFSNGTSSCIACHNIRDGSIIGGGNLSFDLTASYSRLGQAGIQAILTNPPFPVMNAALRDKNLTNEEKEAITAMLHFVNDRYAHKPQGSRDGIIYFALSLVIALFLLIHIYVLYDHRKIPL